MGGSAYPVFVALRGGASAHVDASAPPSSNLVERPGAGLSSSGSVRSQPRSASSQAYCGRTSTKWLS